MTQAHEPETEVDDGNGSESEREERRWQKHFDTSSDDWTPFDEPPAGAASDDA